MEEKIVGCEGETDKRIILKRVLQGEISEEKLQAYLSNLPDVSSCVDEIIVE